MGDVLTMQDITDAVRRLESSNQRPRDGHYRIAVHPDSVVGRAVRAGMSQAEIKRRFGVELVGPETEIVAAPTAHELAAEPGSSKPIAHGKFHIRAATAGSSASVAYGWPPSPDVARAERARLRKWRPPGRKRP